MRPAIVEAALRADLERVRALAEDGADLDAQDEYSQTALLAAAHLPERALSAKWSVVLWLIDRGADVNAGRTYHEGKSTLMLAAERGRLDVVQRLVEHGAEVNAHAKALYETGRTALMFAAETGNLRIVEYLTSHGADVDATREGGETALMLAGIAGHLEVVRHLVTCRADTKATMTYGGTVLLRAAARRRVEVVRFLLDCGADAEADPTTGRTTTTMLGRLFATNSKGSSEGNSALASAVERGILDAARCLLDSGVVVSGVSGSTAAKLFPLAAECGRLDIVRYLLARDTGITLTKLDLSAALVFSAENNHLNVARCLLEHGADANGTREEGMTGLIAAAGRGHTDIVRWLVEQGVGVDTELATGETALEYAAKRGHLEVVKYLMESGANVDAALRDGTAELRRAAENQRWDAVCCFVELGADVNEAVAHGKSLLLCAAESKRTDVVDHLLAHGANVETRDATNKTLLIWAAERGDPGLTRFLLRHGADPNAEDSDGRTAMYFAAQNGHFEIERLLMPLIRVESSVGERKRGAFSPSSSSDWTASHTTLSIPSSVVSWFIPPFEIELLAFVSTKHIGGEYRAKWQDADVAVKLFVSGAHDSTFEQQVTVWHQLRHPNVIKLYGACDVGHHFFVCEFAADGSLTEYLATTGTVGARRTPWKFLLEAALGLAYLHERRIVHGNLRGSSILIGSDGLAKLAEFGLSAPVSNQVAGSKAMSLFGSERWQSPERLRGDEATFASDIYSLGMCIVEATAESAPWSDTRSFSKLAYAKEYWIPQNQDSPYAPAHLSPAVRDIVRLVCCWDPAKRVSAASAVAMLERLAAEEAAAQQQTWQPEPEPLVNITEFANGRMAKLWKQVGGCMANSVVNGPVQRAFKQLEAIYEILCRSSWPYKVVQQFRQVVVDFGAAIDANAYQSRIIRLSSTRATGSNMYVVQRRIDVLWTIVNGDRGQDSAFGERRGQQHWEQQRCKQLQVFVSEVSNTLLVLNELGDEGDRNAFLEMLKTEIEVHGSDYSAVQLAVLQKAHDAIVSDTTCPSVTTRPAWFLPWYELVVDPMERIGYGGFGDVFRGRWLDSEVVVKQVKSATCNEMADESLSSKLQSISQSSVKPKAQVDPDDWKRTRAMFEREVGIWFGLSHPHVVRLFGACHVGRTPFFACEYASHGSLDKYLRAHPDELWQKLYESALGVQFLHARGIIHGDLKCNNVVVGSDKKAKVTDFGLSSDAALLGEARLTGAWQWVAPECLKEGPSRLSATSDVYALGMCILEACRVVDMVGMDPERAKHQYPYPWGNLPNSAVKHHVLEKKLPLRPTGCSDAGWRLIERMCAHEPTERLKISTVVDELAKLAGVGGQEETETAPSNLASKPEHEPIPEIIDELKHVTAADNEALQRTYRLLWDRLEHLSSMITEGGGDLECLRPVVLTARESSLALRSGSATLIASTEAAFRAYTLCRRLDRLIDANGWHVGGKGVQVHNWQAACYSFLGIASHLQEVERA